MALPSDIFIRKATSADRVAVWNIFQSVVSTGDTYTFDPNISEKEAMAYWMGNDKETYVAVSAKNVLGTYIIKDNQSCLGAHIANSSFMVSPEAQGKSVGKKMGLHSLEAAKKLGYKAMQFNIVVSTNQPAVSLWKKLGFDIVGTIPDAFEHKGLKEFVDAYVMYRKL